MTWLHKTDPGHMGLSRINDYVLPTGGLTDQYNNYVTVFAQTELHKHKARWAAYVSAAQKVKSAGSLSLLPQGGFQIRLTAEEVIDWWLWRANEVGVRSANVALNRFLHRREVKGYFYRVARGLKLDKTYRLSEHCKIGNLNALPYFRGKEQYAGRRYLRGEPTRSWHFDYDRVGVLFVPTQMSQTTSSITWDDAEGEIYTNALLINALDGMRVWDGEMGFISEDGYPPGVLSRGWRSGMENQSIPTPKKLSTFGQAEARELRRLRRNISIEGRRLAIALELLREAKLHARDTDAYMKLGMCLEVVCSQGVQGNQTLDSISAKVRRTCAWLLGSNYGDRVSIYDEVGTIYDYRSKVVHTGALPQKFKASERQRHEALCTRIVRERLKAPDISKLSRGLGHP